MEIVIVLAFIAALFAAFYFGAKQGFAALPASRALFGWGVFGIGLATNLGNLAAETAMMTATNNSDILALLLVLLGGVVLAIYGQAYLTGRWAKACGKSVGWAFLLLIPFAFFVMLFAKPKLLPINHTAVAAE